LRWARVPEARVPARPLPSRAARRQLQSSRLLCQIGSPAKEFGGAAGEVEAHEQPPGANVESPGTHEAAADWIPERAPATLTVDADTSAWSTGGSATLDAESRE